jgi:hypothetical protein
VGRTLKTDGDAVMVIGVMPADFKLPSYAQVWTPLARDMGEMKVAHCPLFPRRRTP